MLQSFVRCPTQEPYKSQSLRLRGQKIIRLMGTTKSPFNRRSKPVTSVTRTKNHQTRVENKVTAQQEIKASHFRYADKESSDSCGEQSHHSTEDQSQSLPYGDKKSSDSWEQQNHRSTGDQSQSLRLLAQRII